MNKEKLYELLDITCPEDFEYFESFAAYIECNDEIQVEDITEIFLGAKEEDLAEIINNYFKEIIDSFPREAYELTTIFENEKRALLGLLLHNDDINLFINEIERFREYYSMNEPVVINDLILGEKYSTSICDALFVYRQERFDDSKHDFDFNECLNYELDDYIMSFSDLLNEDYEGEY